MNNELDRALRFDPLDAAEQITGTTYKEDDLTMGVGFGLMQANIAHKDRLLKESNDTTFSNNVEDYLKIAEDIGFKLLLKEKLPYIDGEQEYIFILWHDELSILLDFDTFGGDSVNGGKFHYNIEFHDRKASRFDVTSSGGFYAFDGTRDFEDDDRLIWCGDHDCREGLRHHINNLSKHGTFLKKWVHNPVFCLTGHTDIPERGDRSHEEQMKLYDAITERRVKQLPEDIQEKIKGT